MMIQAFLPLWQNKINQVLQQQHHDEAVMEWGKDSSSDTSSSTFCPNPSKDDAYNQSASLTSPHFHTHFIF